MSAGEGAGQTGSDNTAVRPFQVGFPEAELTELRRRVNATRWPERETVTDDSQGVRLATMQELARYWGGDYDWRACEAKLNALPHFMTEIDGLDIHFIHVRSQHEDALPLIVTHGWPGSIIEQLKIIEPLTNPTAHGASAQDAFHLVIPSLPGYGFSAKPTSTGWDPVRIARAWVVLMKRLGYDQVRGAGRRLGRGCHADDGHPGSRRSCSASTPTCPVPLRRTIDQAVQRGDPPPSDLSPTRSDALRAAEQLLCQARAYAQILSTRPQTMYGLADSPVDLAAFMLDHGDGPASQGWSNRPCRGTWIAT